MLAHIRLENTEMGHWNELGWLGDHSLAAGDEQRPAEAQGKEGLAGQTSSIEAEASALDDWAPW